MFAGIFQPLFWVKILASILEKNMHFPQYQLYKIPICIYRHHNKIFWCRVVVFVYKALESYFAMHAVIPSQNTEFCTALIFKIFWGLRHVFKSTKLSKLHTADPVCTPHRRTQYIFPKANISQNFFPIEWAICIFPIALGKSLVWIDVLLSFRGLISRLCGMGLLIVNGHTFCTLTYSCHFLSPLESCLIGRYTTSYFIYINRLYASTQYQTRYWFCSYCVKYLSYILFHIKLCIHSTPFTS